MASQTAKGMVNSSYNCKIHHGQLLFQMAECNHRNVYKSNMIMYMTAYSTQTDTKGVKTFLLNVIYNYLQIPNKQSFDEINLLELLNLSEGSTSLSVYLSVVLVSRNINLFSLRDRCC